MRNNQAYNFTVHMKNGDTLNFPCMTLNQFGREAKEIRVVDIENIEKTEAVIPQDSMNTGSHLLNFIMGKRI